jgi:hypothetical protein
MKDKLRRFWAFWVALMSERERGTTIALFRMSVGLVIFITFLQLLERGVHEVIWFQFDEGGYRTLGRGPMIIQWLGGLNAENVRLLLWVLMTSSFFVAIGFGGRVSAFVCLQAYITIHRINGESSGSSDILVTNALWLLVLARSTQTLSLDCLVATGKLTSEERIPAWPRYLGVLQMVILYCTTGIQKLSIYWTPFGGFSALYFVLQQPSWVRFDMAWTAWVYPLTQLGTATTWIWEITAPIILVILWYRRTPRRGGRLRYWLTLWDFRLLWALVGLTFHSFILLLMVVGPFSPISMSYYWNLFQPREIHAAWRRVALKLGLAKKWSLPARPIAPAD